MHFLRIFSKVLPALVIASPIQAGPAFRTIDKSPQTAVGADHRAPAHVGKKGGSHPSHKPIHHSAPRHVVHPSAGHHGVHHAVVHKPTRTFRKTVAKTPKAAVGVIVNHSVNAKSNTSAAPAARYASPSYTVRANYRRPNTYNGYFYRRHSHYPGMYGWRHNRYGRRHHRSTNQRVVRGIVEGTTGTANNGSVQVKVFRTHQSRFRNNGQLAANAAKTTSSTLQTVQVNNGTRYEIMSNHQGGFRNGSFHSLQQGEPVLIVIRNRTSNLAQAIEIFPMNRQLAARQQ